MWDVFGCGILCWLLACTVGACLAFYIYGETGKTFYRYITWHHGYFKQHGIPGPKPGFLGILPKYAKMTMLDIDTELMKKHGKVFGYFHAGLRNLNVAEPDMIKEICIKQFNKFIALPLDNVEESIMSLSQDDHWKFNRSLISPSFTTGKMKNLMPFMRKCTANFIQHLVKYADSGKTIDVKNYINGYTLDVICSVAFGIDMDSQEHPDHPVVQAAVKVSTINFGDPYFALCSIFPPISGVLKALGGGFLHRRAKHYLLKVIKEVIEDRNKNPTDRKDFLQIVRDAHEDTKGKDKVFTKYDVWGSSITFLLAGYETTAVTLSFLAYNLATNPVVQEKVVQEINEKLNKDEEPDHDNITKLTYLNMVIEESLRLYSPLVRHIRTCNEDTEINGYYIQKGVDIVIPVATMHRDPDFWENPEVFDPERFTPENKANRNPYVYSPFGIGPRNCIGMRFALIEVKTVIVSLLRKYRFLCAPETERPNVTLAIGELLLKAANGIFLKIEHR